MAVIGSHHEVAEVSERCDGWFIPWLVSCSGTIGFEPFLKYLFSHLDCHFLWIDASCDGCNAWGRQCLLNPEHLAVLSACPISRNSIRLLIVTTDFVALHWFTGYVVFIVTSFPAGVEPGDQCLLNSQVLSCLSVVIMSIRSVFLFSKPEGSKVSQKYALIVLKKATVGVIVVDFHLFTLYK